MAGKHHLTTDRKAVVELLPFHSFIEWLAAHFFFALSLSLSLFFLFAFWFICSFGDKLKSKHGWLSTHNVCVCALDVWIGWAADMNEIKRVQMFAQNGRICTAIYTPILCALCTRINCVLFCEKFVHVISPLCCWPRVTVSIAFHYLPHPIEHTDPYINTKIAR